MVKSIVDTLIYRLSDKNVPPLETPRLVKDVLDIINRGDGFTLDRINENLSNLGWKEELLDGHLLDLILQLVETEENSDEQTERYIQHCHGRR